MSITIDGIPEHLTREQYVGIFTAFGVDSDNVIELRAAHDGVHAVVIATDENGKRVVDPRTARYVKHRVFIPVRDDDTDTRTTRVTAVGN